MVDSILNSGLQGINSGVNRVQQAAQDIATATTTDTFSPNSPTAQPGTPGTPTTAPTTTPSDGDITADLATSIVDLKIGEIQVKASAKVIETADALIGAIIDIKA